MAKRESSDQGKKPPRRTVTGAIKVDSGLGRAKGDKSRSSTSRTTVKNLTKSVGGTPRKAAPLPGLSGSIMAGKSIKTMVKERPKRINKRDAAPRRLSARQALEAALAHHDRPITAAEARRMNKIIRADRPAPELRPRRR
jgi:hypothetical protein